MGVMVCACGMSEVWDPNVMVWGISVMVCGVSVMLHGMNLRCTKHGKSNCQSSGRALVAMRHHLQSATISRQAVSLNQSTHVKMLKGESLNTYNQNLA